MSLVIGGRRHRDREATATERSRERWQKFHWWVGRLEGHFDQNRCHNPFCAPSVVPETYQLPGMSCTERSRRLTTAGQQVEPSA